MKNRRKGKVTEREGKLEKVKRKKANKKVIEKKKKEKRDDFIG